MPYERAYGSPWTDEAEELGHFGSEPVQRLESPADTRIPAERPDPGHGFGGTGSRAEPVRVGDLVVDVWNVLAWMGAERLELRLREVELLALLASRPGELLTREELANELWDYDEARLSRTIDMHVAHLRAALAEVTSHSYIRTVRGFGYRFVPPEWD